MNRMRDIRTVLPRFRTSDESHRVTTFELFFDLVFVFALTQVTEFMAHASSAEGVLQGLIVLGILWWSWTSYSWLGNQTFVDEGLIRIGMTVAMTAMFLVALVIPESFEDLPGGLYAPLVLTIAYIVVRVAHLLLYLAAAGDDGPLRRQVLITTTALATGSVLMIAGAVLDGGAQTWLWLLGLVLDVGITYATSRRGNWRVHSSAHWSERYGLVVILALGESIVAIGVGVAEEAISVPILLGSVLAVGLSVLLWWLYFDMAAIAAEHALARLRGSARAALAIDGYTYLHFPILAGVVISALGVEEAMHHVEDTEPFGLFGAAALFGGTALYLAGHGAFWRRSAGYWKVWRMGGATLLVALVPVGAAVSALAALVGVVGLTAAIVVVETIVYAEARSAIRSSQHAPAR
jgi:low temperature requirement protein LtrA